MIVIISPTGGRPKQFELCMRWMKQQTYTGKVVWIIVDDCSPITSHVPDDFRYNWSIIKRYPKPVWKFGENTQGRNLKYAVETIKTFPTDWVEGIFVIEDDDYYKPEYLEVTRNALRGFQATGEVKTIYYNVTNRTYKEMPNVKHSSLFQTGFTIDVLPIFEKYLNDRFIDINFFKNVPNVNLFEAGKLTVGIKGLPGRGGIGVGHRIKGIPDPNMYKLKELIGEDYKFYQ